MLVLTRRVGERIRIGKDVEIVVLRLKNGQVRIGIEAPRDTHIVRSEIDERKDRAA